MTAMHAERFRNIPTSAARGTDLLEDWRSFDIELRADMRAGCNVDLGAIVPADGIGYLYVIEFSTGVIKVGQTRDPQRRLGEHRRSAGAFGVSITQFWLSPPHANYLETEAALIIDCAEFSPYSKREYFHAINWSEAVEDAFALTRRRKA